MDGRGAAMNHVDRESIEAVHRYTLHGENLQAPRLYTSIAILYISLEISGALQL